VLSSCRAYRSACGSSHLDNIFSLILEAAITTKIVAPKPGFAEATIKNTAGYDFSFWLLKNQFVAGLQTKDPNDPEITAIATAILNSAVPYARRKDGWDNDIEQWTKLVNYRSQVFAARPAFCRGRRTKMFLRRKRN
jgi:hypothetical protein